MRHGRRWSKKWEQANKDTKYLTRHECHAIISGVLSNGFVSIPIGESMKARIILRDIWARNSTRAIGDIVVPRTNFSCDGAGLSWIMSRSTHQLSIKVLHMSFKSITEESFAKAKLTWHNGLPMADRRVLRSFKVRFKNIWSSEMLGILSEL